MRRVADTRAMLLLTALRQIQPPPRVYPSRVQIVVNRTAATRSGLELSPSIADHVDAVLP